MVAQYLTNSFIDTMVLLITNDWKPRLQFSWRRASLLVAVSMGIIVYCVGLLELKTVFLLIAQIVIGAIYYILVRKRRNCNGYG